MADLLQTIDREVREHGTAADRDRLADAAKALDFLRGCFDRWVTRPPDFGRDYQRYTRHSLLMRRVIDTLCADLYRQGPARRLPDHPEAEAWLNDLYARNNVDALMQQADRLALAADACAIEVQPTEDPDCPLKLVLWDASSFMVWASPDDPLKPAAVATVDMYDNTRRLTLWTDTEIRRYSTAKLGVGQTSGGTAYTLQAVEPNPYNVIPFAFVHADLPVTQFWTPGPGSALTTANDYINHALTAMGDAVRFGAMPIMIARHVREGWRPPSVQPGDIWELPPGYITSTGDGPEASLEYLQPDLAFIPAGWEDIENYVDLILESAGVPPAAYRMSESAVKSGAALAAEQVPLAHWAESRTRPFGKYEADLAQVVLAVGAAHYKLNGQPRPDLEAAAAAPGLVLHWPDFLPQASDPAADAGDLFELQNGLTTRVKLIQKRKNLTREEAIAYLRELAEDEKVEAELFPTANEISAPPAPQTAQEATGGQEADQA